MIALAGVIVLENLNHGRGFNALPADVVCW